MPSYEKRYHPPVYSQDIPFRGKSSYRQNYTTFSNDSTELYKTNLAKSYIATIQIAPKDKLNDATTYNQSMKDYSNLGLNSRILVKPREYERPKSVQGHFRTTSASVFKEKTSATKDPRQLRIALMSKK